MLDRGIKMDAREQRRRAEENAAAQDTAKQIAAIQAWKRRKEDSARKERIWAEQSRSRQAEARDKIESALQSSTSDTSVTIASLREYPAWYNGERDDMLGNLGEWRQHAQVEAERLRSLGYRVNVEESPRKKTLWNNGTTQYTQGYDTRIYIDIKLHISSEDS